METAPTRRPGPGIFLSPSLRTTVVRGIPFVVLALAILAVPRFIFKPGINNYELDVLMFVGLNTILVVGLNLLMGYAGQVSLGHAAFYGLGAYVSAVLTTQGMPQETTGPAAMVVAVLAACAGIAGLARASATCFVISLGGFMLVCALVTYIGPAHWLPYVLAIVLGFAISFLCRLSPVRLLGAYGLGGAAGAAAIALLRNSGPSTSAMWPWLAMLAGVGFTCLIAYLIGIQALRLQGYYLAMATLGFGIIVWIIFRQWEPVTGGTSGIYGLPSLRLGKIALDQEIAKYYFVWALAGAVILLSTNIVNSRVGRAFRAVHGSEVAAATLGVDVARYKIRVFVLSAALASVAGSIYAHYTVSISPQPFDLKFSIELVVMVVVGGLGSIWGAIFGAGAIVVLGEVLRELGDKHVLVMGKPLSDYDVIIFGLILILIMIFLPSGLVRGALDSVKFASRLGRRGS